MQETPDPNRTRLVGRQKSKRIIRGLSGRPRRFSKRDLIPFFYCKLSGWIFYPKLIQFTNCPLSTPLGAFFMYIKRVGQGSIILDTAYHKSRFGSLVHSLYDYWSTPINRRIYVIFQARAIAQIRSLKQWDFSSVLWWNERRRIRPLIEWSRDATPCRLQAWSI